MERYEALHPLAGVIDIKRIWRVLKLPDLPPTFCHVGLLGWHCHNTTLHPWDPKSLIPKDQMPPMPANASCVICPAGWHGSRRNIVDVLLDIPFVQAQQQQQRQQQGMSSSSGITAGKSLPQGFYDMQALLQQQHAPGAAKTLGA